MTFNEFKAWLEGFETGVVGAAPTPEQWAAIKAKLETVTAIAAPAKREYLELLTPPPRLPPRIWYDGTPAENRAGCFAIRLHGRCWLKTMRQHSGPTLPVGWRALVWARDVADAEKWATRDAAERFAAGLPAPHEIVDLEKSARLSPVSA